MERDDLLELSLHITDASLTFLIPREDEKTINVVAKEVDALNEKKKKQVAAVLHYVENTHLCRSLQLVNYFGEENTVPCGICSVCCQASEVLKRKEANRIAAAILALLKSGALSSRDISEKLTFTESNIVQVLQLLVDSEKISMNATNQYTLRS
jgi:ATP-dependent DNA helicase RecQ